jgi:aspartyl-tRNA synthetase
MHAYRTHSCADLRKSDVESTVRLSGWIHRKRDHGGVLFVDLRDHYGLTQIVCAAGGEPLKILDQLKLESVVTITGKVVEREGGAVNPKLATGDIEVVARRLPFSRRPTSCRCRWRARPTIRRKSGSNTAISTCAATACMPTSCCARR